MAYLAVDPTFPHHLNSFDNVPVNYTAGDIVHSHHNKGEHNLPGVNSEVLLKHDQLHGPGSRQPLHPIHNSLQQQLHSHIHDQPVDQGLLLNASAVPYLPRGTKPDSLQVEHNPLPLRQDHQRPLQLNHLQLRRRPGFLKIFYRQLQVVHRHQRRLLPHPHLICR